jgi:hypothetical protein
MTVPRTGSDPETARRFETAAATDFHVFPADGNQHLLVVDGSQVFMIDNDLAQCLSAPESGRGEAISAHLARHGLGLKRFIGGEPLENPPLRALSLAVAERCNLGCTYCYAEGGSFGGAPREMPWDVAEASRSGIWRPSEATCSNARAAHTSATRATAIATSESRVPAALRGMDSIACTRCLA